MGQEQMQELPFERKFPSRTEIVIYPAEGAGRATVIEGRGYWTLLFEPTGKPEIVSVRLVDAQVHFRPFHAIFDIDGDGRLEYLDIEGFVLGAGEFDMERSRGTLNLETGTFSMEVAHVLSPKAIPMLEGLTAGPLAFSFTERGRMDLETGEFSTEAGVFNLPEPLHMVTIRGCEDCPPARSSVNLWVNCVAPPVNPNAVADKPPPNKEITICPEDPILLTWRSSNDVTKCKLEPGYGEVPRGASLAVVPGPKVETVYKITTIGGYSTASDTVTVHIFDGRKPLQFTADPVPGEQPGWSAVLPPECWSGSIRAKEVRLKQPLEGEDYARCFDWKFTFHIDHWSPGAASPDSVLSVTQGFKPIVPAFSVAGTWEFWPNYPQAEKQKLTNMWKQIVSNKVPLCFAVKGECPRT